ncbi:MAG: hypothetical protein K1X53_15035 [Candidatus Sumerlaeaceae bacterium]|nr:hypothetical protein [Candidatus Sumerlaeaceae bacterium]
MGQTEVVSDASSDNRNAQIAATGDGLIGAWDGLVSGHRRILVREKRGGTWLRTEIVDSEPVGENSIQSLCVDSAGNPHLVWLSKVGEKFRITYVSRIAGIWSRPVVVNNDQPGGENCEEVSIQLSPEDRPWIIWQSGNGNRYSIQAATPDSQTGLFVIDRLNTDVLNYNLYPVLLFTPEPTVLWYSASNADFVLVGKRFRGAWEIFPIENLDNLPVSRCLPALIRAPKGNLAGFWFDELDAADRVFVGLQESETRGSGVPLDNEADSSFGSICATAAGDRMVATWTSEQQGVGQQIIAAVGDAPPFELHIVSGSDSAGYCGAPKVAGNVRKAAVIWNSLAGEGGDGRVYCREISF